MSPKPETNPLDPVGASAAPQREGGAVAGPAAGEELELIDLGGGSECVGRPVQDGMRAADSSAVRRTGENAGPEVIELDDDAPVSVAPPRLFPAGESSGDRRPAQKPQRGERRGDGVERISEGTAEETGAGAKPAAGEEFPPKGNRTGNQAGAAGPEAGRRRAAPGGGTPVQRSGARPRKPRLQLPFDNRREDAGSWAYDHRIGLCVTLIAYLVLMIVFVSSKIVIGERPHQQGMYIELQSLAELEAERARLEQEVRERQAAEEFDWRSVRNTVSNENELNEQLKDDRGTNTAALNDAAAAAEERMRANREAYEQGLAEEAAIRRGRTADEASGEHRDRKVKGRVTVSFSLTDPVRQSVDLSIPAYRCEGGGEVVVAITVSRGGEVIGARIVSGGDDCMREAALHAARVSTFNIDPKAPARHQGTITYTFIPQ